MSAVETVATKTVLITPPQMADLKEVGEQVGRFQATAEDAIAQAQRALIASEKDFTTGTDFLTIMKTNVDELEKIRKAVKAPIDNYAQMIQDLFLPIKNQIETAGTLMRGKMVAFRTEENRKAAAAAEELRKQQEAEALERAAALEKQGNTVAAAAVLDMAATPLVAPVQKTEARRGALGGKASTRDTWKAEIVNKREALQAILNGDINFNLDDISFGQAALNKLASSKKMEGTFFGVKVSKETGLNLRS